MNDPLGTKQILEVLLIIAAGVGGFGVLLMLLMRGIWSKMGEPVVKELFKAWQNSPETITAQETFVKKVIDNEIRRDDGLIHKEIKRKTEETGEKLLEAFTELTTKIEGKEDSRETFEKQIAERLSKIEGAIRAMLGGKRPVLDDSDPKFPQIKR